MITSTGEGLNILILCDFAPSHDWMGFVCWHSLNKNLPDAKVGILCNRNRMQWQLFDWTRQCEVEFSLHTPINKENQVSLALKRDAPLLILEPDIMAVDDLDPKLLELFSENEKLMGSKLCLDAKDEDVSSFVSYRNGWGKFNSETLANKMVNPLTNVRRYSNSMMTVNETKIMKLWEQASLMFRFLSKD